MSDKAEADTLFALAERIASLCQEAIVIRGHGIQACAKDSGHEGNHASNDFEWWIETLPGGMWEPTRSGP